MSKVHVSLHRDAAHGKAPITGPMRFAPSKRRSAGQNTILPAGFDVDLVDGEAVVDLDATGPDWCWCAYEPTLRGAIRSILVPEAGDDEVLEYEGLTDVDPSTLEPSPEALAGWTATLNEVREIRNDAVATIPLMESTTAAAEAAQDAAAQALAARDAAQGHADDAHKAAQAAEAAKNSAAEHEREAGQIVEDATAQIPGLISEQVTAQIDPKVATATQAKDDAETARDAAQTARDDALQAKAQAVAAQEAARADTIAALAATDVEQITLTGNLALTIPEGHPAGQVYRCAITQTTGGHTVTYGPDTLAIDTDPGASTLVEIWPGGEVTYPGAVVSGGVTDHGALTGLGDDDHSAVYVRFTIGASGPAVPRAGDFWMVTP